MTHISSNDDVFAHEVEIVLTSIGNMLRAKNRAYGDSALNPVRIFSRADPISQIDVRIDDKLSRLARGSNAGEDTHADLLGYLVLRQIAVNRLKRTNPTINPTTAQ